MRNLIAFARAMRAQGYRYRRARRGVMHFGIRFPGGFGVTTAIPVEAVLQGGMAPAKLARFILERDAISAGFDLRAAA